MPGQYVNGEKAAGMMFGKVGSEMANVNEFALNFGIDNAYGNVENKFVHEPWDATDTERCISTWASQKCVICSYVAENFFPEPHVSVNCTNLPMWPNSNATKGPGECCNVASSYVGVTKACPDNKQTAATVLKKGKCDFDYVSKLSLNDDTNIAKLNEQKYFSHDLSQLHGTGRCSLSWGKWKCVDCTGFAQNSFTSTRLSENRNNSHKRNSLNAANWAGEYGNTSMNHRSVTIVHVDAAEGRGVDYYDDLGVGVPRKIGRASWHANP